MCWTLQWKIKNPKDFSSNDSIYFSVNLGMYDVRFVHEPFKTAIFVYTKDEICAQAFFCLKLWLLRFFLPFPSSPSSLCIFACVIVRWNIVSKKAFSKKLQTHLKKKFQWIQWFSKWITYIVKHCEQFLKDFSFRKIKFLRTQIEMLL